MLSLLILPKEIKAIIFYNEKILTPNYRLCTHLKAGMSNWRPRCIFNAARCDLFQPNYHLKLEAIHKIWLANFCQFYIKMSLNTSNFDSQSVM